MDGKVLPLKNIEAICSNKRNAELIFNTSDAFIKFLIFITKRLRKGSLFLSKYLEKVEWLVYTIDQIKNRNFLSPTGFKFVLNRAPKVSFFGNEANIPDLNLGIAEQPTYLKDIPLPGDKVTFGDFNLRFLVDENLENYNEISNWIRSVGYAETLQKRCF